MRKFPLGVIAFYLLISPSPTKSQRSDFYYNHWFVPEDNLWGYGSRPATETPCPTMYPVLISKELPYCTLEPEPGECLCNSERICSALFSTYYLEPDVPLTYAGDIVYGEYRFEEGN